jgi:hypothetical protein
LHTKVEEREHLLIWIFEYVLNFVKFFKTEAKAVNLQLLIDTFGKQMRTEKGPVSETPYTSCVLQNPVRKTKSKTPTVAHHHQSPPEPT